MGVMLSDLSSKDDPAAANGERRALLRAALGGLLLTVATLAIGAWVIATDPSGSCAVANTGKEGILALEFARTGERTVEIMRCWTDDDLARISTGLDRDTAYVASYVAAIGYWSGFGAIAFRRPRARAAGWIAIGMVAVAGVCDLVENHFLRRVVSAWPDRIDTDAIRNAYAATLPKWILCGIALVYALGALASCTARVVRVVRVAAVTRVDRRKPHEER